MIIAHEFGHILQYKSGMAPDGPWQMEPHADFIAGWVVAKAATRSLPAHITKIVQGLDDYAVHALFNKGDSLFNDPAHHGEPELRAAMVRSGYDASSLDFESAFEKGKTMAGLRPLQLR